MALLYILVLFQLLRTKELQSCKIISKTRRGVCLSQETRSLKRTNLASLSGSCSHFEMLSDFNSLDASEPFHIRPRELINIEQLDKFLFGE